MNKQFVFIVVSTILVLFWVLMDSSFIRYFESFKLRISTTFSEISTYHENSQLLLLVQKEKLTCQLPEFTSIEQCRNINKENTCSYTCKCYKYLTIKLPGVYQIPISTPIQDMVSVEAMTLRDPEFLDLSDTASVKLTKLSFLTSVDNIRVGDEFKILIQLFDGAGRPRQVGGDDVRVWIKSSDFVYKASGEVVDHYNGTYVATFKAIWEGNSLIFFKLAYTREELATRFMWNRQYGTLSYLVGQYKKAEVVEYTPCTFFQTIPGHGEVCNFTMLNNGQPWYCGKPNSTKLGCADINLFKEYGQTHIPLTKAQRELIFNRKSHNRILKTKLKFHFQNGQLLKLNQNCNVLDKKETWNTKMPSGYFNSSKWISLKCKNTLDNSSFESCLKNMDVIIMGDSTTRQYFSYITSKVVHDCILVTEKWKWPQWHSPSKCVSKNRNLTISWNPHELPFSDAKLQGGELNLKSTARILNELPSNRKIVFVIHYYAHMIRQHSAIVLRAIRGLKSAIKKALSRNKNVVIAVKTPHSFGESRCESHFADFMGPVFIELFNREFRELQDSILNLNVWEMSVASENFLLHPKEIIVREHLRMLFGYICN
ncbi:hypothetical protein LOTGIDRAFT_238812 [Lottia gigantea]|uniref:NXPE C-terminal domain-containing protein n=1 Tax=Lottia gigantea TaxID=225164 RepID=V4AZP9_LOTGI|nr:hypothetical protein LOTGIDRAFT_238812 [Lottia gigantea]ESO99206.1 hypothetical protein LOTGIDRAFT_238812 [Lottia gigantea]